MDIGLRIERLNGSGGFFICLCRVEIRFIDKNHGLGTAASDDGEEALHAAKAEICPRIRDDDDDVHIGGDDLLLGAFAGHFPREACLTWQACADDIFSAICTNIKGDPISD